MENNAAENKINEKKNSGKPKRIAVIIAVALIIAVAAVIISFSGSKNDEKGFGTIAIDGCVIFENNSVYDSAQLKTDSYVKTFIGEKAEAFLITNSIRSDFNGFANPVSLTYICSRGQKQLTDQVVSYAASYDGSMVYFTSVQNNNFVNISLYDSISNSVSVLGIEPCGTSVCPDIKTDYSGKMACISFGSRHLYYRDGICVGDNDDYGTTPEVFCYDNNCVITRNGQYGSYELCLLDLKTMNKQTVFSGNSDAVIDHITMDGSEFIINDGGVIYHYSVKKKKLTKLYNYGYISTKSDYVETLDHAVLNGGNIYLYEDDCIKLSDNFQDVTNVLVADSCTAFFVSNNKLFGTKFPSAEYKNAHGTEKLLRFIWDSAVSEGGDSSDIQIVAINDALLYHHNFVYSEDDKCIYYITSSRGLWKYGLNGKNTKITDNVEDIKLGASGKLFVMKKPENSELTQIYSYKGKKHDAVTPDLGRFELFESNGRVYYSDSTSVSQAQMRNAYGTYPGTEFWVENLDGSFEKLYTAQ